MLEVRELEAFLAVADELHFGRAGERLHVSQSRVSQLLAALERRVGARLVERTSRRVRLTPLGARFAAELRPAYEELGAVVARARESARGIEGRLRIGFQGTADHRLMAAIALFQERHPGCVTEIVEVPFADPFGAVRHGDVDVAIVLLPVEEPDVVLGPTFSRERQNVAVSVRHPFAARAEVTAADLAAAPLIPATAPAPAYWRAAHAPTTAPGPAVRTLQEGLTLVAAGRGAMLLCRPTAEYHGRRDVVHVPVTGLPDSVLGVVWQRDAETERVRAFARAVSESTAGRPRSADSRTPPP
ncbi:LysR family transcriptional regulator [Streptomyces sp. KL116D]|uniref:LysR family transcriptional regulator n=1 Tax=Streptomyces sp. KL116D TaxID=3045152 RepID=UPI0035578745